MQGSWHAARWSSSSFMSEHQKIPPPLDRTSLDEQQAQLVWVYVKACEDQAAKGLLITYLFGTSVLNVEVMRRSFLLKCHETRLLCLTCPHYSKLRPHRTTNCASILRDKCLLDTGRDAGSSPSSRVIIEEDSRSSLTDLMYPSASFLWQS